MNGRYIDLNFPNELFTPEGFYDRDEGRGLIQSLIEQGFPRPIVIVGERRIGKTSLRHVALGAARDLGYDRITPTFKSYSLEGFVEELLSEVCAALEFPIREAYTADERGGFRFSPSACANAMRRVFERFPGRRVVLDIDEFDHFISQCDEAQGKLVLDFLGKLIDREQHNLPLKVFLTMTYCSGLDRHDYVSTFLQSAELVRLEPFKLEDTARMARGLLSGVLHFPDETVRRLQRFSGGHPFFTKLMLKHLHRNYYLRGTGELVPGEAVCVSPEMLDIAIQDTVEDDQANFIMENILLKHMSADEQRVLQKLVQAGGHLNRGKLTADEQDAVYGLGRRRYLRYEGEQCVFNIEYLYHFIEKRGQLILPRRQDSGAGGRLRVHRMKVYRGQQRLDLAEDELHLFHFMFQRRDEMVVTTRAIFDYMATVGYFPPTGIDTPDARRVRVRILVLKLRARIEDDPDAPYYLVEFGRPDDPGYKLENVETD